MLEVTRSPLLRLARAAAVVFALTLCGYLVVAVQRRANPTSKTHNVQVDEGLAESLQATTFSVDGQSLLPSSKVLVLDPPGARDVVRSYTATDSHANPVFLSSSKTLNWTPHPHPPPLVFLPPSAGPIAEVPTSLPNRVHRVERVQLGSSKSFDFSEIDPAGLLGPIFGDDVSGERPTRIPKVAAEATPKSEVATESSGQTSTTRGSKPDPERVPSSRQLRPQPKQKSPRAPAKQPPQR